MAGEGLYFFITYFRKKGVAIKLVVDGSIQYIFLSQWSQFKAINSSFVSP